MSLVETIPVQSRQATGTGGARATRREGLVPGVVYGNKKEPHHIALDARPILKELYKPGFFSRLFTISVDGKEEHVLAKAVQLNPVTDHPIHIDFQRVGKDSKITLNIPLRFINDDKAPGVKKGGSVNIVHHTLELSCPAMSIPEEIIIDLAKLEINSGIHLSELTLPKGTSAVHTDHEVTIVTIVAPSGAKGEEESEA